MICKGKVVQIEKSASGEILYQVQLDDGLIVNNARVLSMGGSETRFTVQGIIEGAIVVLIYERDFIPIILGCIHDVVDRQSIGLGISTKPITSDVDTISYADTHLSNARASLNLGVNGLSLSSDIIRMQLNQLRITHNGLTSDVAINGQAFIDALVAQWDNHINHIIVLNTVLLSLLTTLQTKAILTPQETASLLTSITQSTSTNITQHIPSMQIADALSATLNQRIHLP
jgi:hypothetical protein